MQRHRDWSVSSVSTCFLQRFLPHSRYRPLSAVIQASGQDLWGFIRVPFDLADRLGLGDFGSGKGGRGLEG